jgi:2-octaprenyl-6-methoxyphenol hydroxylase
MQQRKQDVVIAGGGLAGYALALAIKSALGGSLAVTLCDPVAAMPTRRSGRAYAIAASGRRMFEALGVWHRIVDRAQPITRMEITDSRLSDPIRPVFLTFDGAVEDGEPFAHMVEVDDLAAVLRQAALAAGLEERSTAVTKTAPQGDRLNVSLSDGTQVQTSLVAACDGARSRLRELAGIAMIGWDYGQSGIVATLAHERDHEGRAEEHFLPSGPFAILPLHGRRSSIVWTERSDRVDMILSLDEEDLLQEIERRFTPKLGALRLVGPVSAHPLALRVARSFIAPRLALVGDAAHIIHPIAGQGLNLGLRDVASLAEAIVDAAALGLDVGGDEVLTGYQRSRRVETVGMGVVTDGLNRLFSNDVLPMRLARDLGLGLVDRLPWLKRSLIREAAGAGSEPRLLRGEAI